MQKTCICLFPLLVFLLSACSGTSPREKTAVIYPSGTVTDVSTNSPGSIDSLTINKPNTTDANKNITAIETDLWQRIKTGLRLPRNIKETTTAKKVAWFARNQPYIDRVAERASPYLYHIVEELEKRDMPLDIALLPIIESAYNPFAYSPSHASGIWQFIPATGRHYGLKQNWWYDGRRDIVAATDAALNYLQKLHNDFNGDWHLALAAYNAGEGTIGKAIRRNKKLGKATDFFALKLSNETRAYVPGLLAIAEIVSNPEKYKISIKPLNNIQYFKQIDTNSQIDLAKAAELSHLSIEELYTLNPGFNRWATDPAGPHRLLIPVNKATAFEQQIAVLTTQDRIKWQKHTIKQGESLGRIATRYRTEISALKQMNHLQGNTIHAGDSLLIPIAQKPLQHYSLSLDSRRYKGLKPNGQAYVYTIKRGDNLWDIGQHYGISVKQLSAWNNISSQSILRPGNKLDIWIGGKNNRARAMPVTSRKTTVASQHVSYIVQHGDSLWSISKRFGVSVKEVKKWNSLARKRHIKPGQVLDIYTGILPKDA